MFTLPAAVAALLAVAFPAQETRLSNVAMRTNVSGGGQLINIATRLRVGTGVNVPLPGFPPTPGSGTRPRPPPRLRPATRRAG